jgi:CRISPR associated protein Cas1
LFFSPLGSSVGCGSSIAVALNSTPFAGKRWQPLVGGALNPVGGLAQIPELERATTMKELRLAESIAGRQYWQCFANLPIRFERRWREQVPEHWYRAGPRTAPGDNWKRAKGARTPVHALVNYLNAILQTEATIAAQRMGFDPTLGLMHADKRYRPSLASDLMEPVRPVVDRSVVELLEERELRRGSWLRRGRVCVASGLPLCGSLPTSRICFARRYARTPSGWRATFSGPAPIRRP